jgi:phage terminase large subunit
VDSQYPAYDKGSIYGHLLAAVEARGGLLAFEHPLTGLHVFLDLGRADSTALWAALPRPGGVDVVAHYENHGLELSHYFRVIEKWEHERGYRFSCFHLPHDARAKTLTTKRSVAEQFVDKFGVARVRIVPQLDVDDGIAAARHLLEGDIRFHVRCTESPEPGIASGWEALAAYKYEWNEKLQTFSRVPLHDWASHTADAFRYLAVGLSGIMPAAQPPPPQQPAPTAITLGNPWDEN